MFDFCEDGVEFSGEVKSNNLDVKVKSELEAEEKGMEQESTRESDSTILDVSSDYPRGWLIKSKNIYCMLKERRRKGRNRGKGKGTSGSDAKSTTENGGSLLLGTALKFTSLS